MTKVSVLLLLLLLRPATGAIRSASDCRVGEDVVEVDLVVCDSEDQPTIIDTSFQYTMCSVLEDAVDATCETRTLAASGNTAQLDCTGLTIRGCNVYCVGGACHDTTFVDSEVKAVVRDSPFEHTTAKLFQDSDVDVESCLASTGKCSFLNSNVYLRYSAGGSFRFSTVYVLRTVADFFDSTVNCAGSCSNSRFDRSSVRCPNNNDIPAKLCFGARFTDSEVFCEMPTFEVPTGQFDSFCGNSDDPDCSCCRGEGCAAAAMNSDLTPPLCDQAVCDATPYEANQTCTDRKNPYCTRDPFCTTGHLAASLGDPHIISFDGLDYECQVAGEVILLSDRRGSRQINALFTKVADNVFPTVTTGIAVKSPLLRGEQQVQVVLTEGKAVSGDSINGCGIQFYSSTDTPVSLEQVIRSIAWPDVTVQEKYDPPGIRMDFPTLGIHLTLHVEIWGGVCLFSAEIELDCTHDHGELEGVLGNANEDKTDDWINATTGESAEYPKETSDRWYKPAYEQCAQWCVEEWSGSLFRGFLGSPAGLADISKCSEPYSGPSSPSGRRRGLEMDLDAVSEVCDADDVPCRVEGSTLGADAARAYLAHRERIARRQAELSPGGTFAPTSEPSAAPSVKGTSEPSVEASAAPSAGPSVSPSAGPSVHPSASPSVLPSASIDQEEEECTAFFLICFFRWLLGIFF